MNFPGVRPLPTSVERILGPSRLHCPPPAIPQDPPRNCPRQHIDCKARFQCLSRAMALHMNPPGKMPWDFSPPAHWKPSQSVPGSESTTMAPDTLVVGGREAGQAWGVNIPFGVKEAKVTPFLDTSALDGGHGTGTADCWEAWGACGSQPQREMSSVAIKVMLRRYSELSGVIARSLGARCSTAKGRVCISRQDKETLILWQALIPKIHPQFIHSQNTLLFLWKEKSEAGGKCNIVTDGRVLALKWRSSRIRSARIHLVRPQSRNLPLKH
ncbi:hypothetical protein B0H14DRAFT_3666540 [Mycena olivaceomarginata]|nr:hypothetical protein B0H14DRAFT_3666540 [Mycena olivaceomarginata]